MADAWRPMSQRRKMNAQAPENVVDLELALARVGGDEELLREIAVLFIEECPRALVEIQEAVAAGDATTAGERGPRTEGFGSELRRAECRRSRLSPRTDGPCEPNERRRSDGAHARERVVGGLRGTRHSLAGGPANVTRGCSRRQIFLQIAQPFRRPDLIEPFRYLISR